MEDRHKHSININRLELIRGIDVDVSLILDDLRSKRVLTKEEIEIIRCAKTTFGKAQELVYKVEAKSDPTIFERFVHCLGQHDNKHLGDLLEISANEWTEEIAEKELETWLKDNYHVDDGSSTSFTQLLNHACASDLPVGNKGNRLLNVIPRVFRKVELKLSEGRQAYLPCHTVENLMLIVKNTAGVEARNPLERQEDKNRRGAMLSGFGCVDDSSKTICNLMEDWNVEQLCSWVSQSNLPQELKEKTQKVFRKEDIDGSEFGSKSFPKECMLSLLRPLTYGNLSKLINYRDKYFCGDIVQNESPRSEFHVKQANHQNVPEDQPSEQICRKFGSEGSLFTYRQNIRLLTPDDIANSSLTPIHMYLDASMPTEVKTITNIVEEILRFSCACLNDRQNGTLHVGVSAEGIVQGIKLAKDALENAITESLKTGYSSDVHHAVRYCLKSPNYIELTDHNGQRVKDGSCVVEIDIIPDTQVCKDRTFFVKTRVFDENAGHQQRPALYRLKDGKPEVQHDESIHNFYEERDELKWKRGMEEQQAGNIPNKQYLRERILELIYRGDPKSMTDLFPVLLLGPRPKERDASCSVDSMSFVKDINWKVVYDFDDNSSLLDHLEHSDNLNMRALLINDFIPKGDARKECRDKQEDILNSEKPLWIFANGHSDQSDEPHTDPMKWKREKGHAFQESVKILSSLIPADRAVIVFVLPDSGTQVITEAACYICNEFPDQFVILADDKKNAARLTEALIQRNMADTGTVEKQTLSNAPWKIIKSVLEEFSLPKEAGNIAIPHSEMGSCSLRNYDRSRWTDLEILGCDQCEHDAQVNDSRDTSESAVEEQFYKGQEVSWWNFFYKDQVMKRHVFDELNALVESALTGKLFEYDRDRIAGVTIYHQPGAGGTTVAKHVLWNLRKETRCAIVRTITENTADQLMKYRDYNESYSPGPVLVMLDNRDEEKLGDLVLQIEHKVMATRAHMTRETCKQAAFVFLQCTRSTEIPAFMNDSSVVLIQQLHEEEKCWLQKKSLCLDKKFVEKKGMDPQFLISFNILKEGFDKSHISKTVERLLTDIKKPKERKLLKYIAFLNMYDLRHRPIPAGVFHNMMQEISYTRSGLRGKALAHWESCLSYPLLILLNQTTILQCGRVRAFGIIHPLLSEELLESLRKADNQTVGDVALELMGNNEIRFSNSHAQRELNRLIADLLKQRDHRADGTQLPFSPLVQSIKESEDPEKAIEVFTAGFELTNDAFVAQQIARFYIRLENWPKATEYAKAATTMRPDNSYLHDTCAQVFMKQIEVRKREMGKRHISLEAAGQIIDLGIEAQEWLFCVSKLSRAGNMSGKINNAGYFGEIKVFIDIVHCLQRVGALKGDVLTQILGSSIHAFSKWKNQKSGKRYVDILREMGARANYCIRHLDDEVIQIRLGYSDDLMAAQKNVDLRKLDEMKREMARYFGSVPGTGIQPTAPLEEQCKQRRKLAYYHGNSLRSILQLQKEGKDDQLRELQALYMANVHSEQGNAVDFRGILNVTFALHSRKVPSCGNVTLKDIINWSNLLYQMKDMLKDESLEPYLYFILVNWPGRSTETVATPTAVMNCQKEWGDIFKKKYLGDAEDRLKWMRDKIWFMFARGVGLDAYVLYHDIRKSGTEGGKVRLSNKDLWQTDAVRRRLERFQGTLNRQGDSVAVKVIRNDNVQRISIPVFPVVSNPQMYNKTVSFVLGFTWAGPKALDISTELKKESSPRSSPRRPKHVHQTASHVATGGGAEDWGTLMDQDVRG